MRIEGEGAIAIVEFETNDGGGVKVTCLSHHLNPVTGNCSWTRVYDNWNDATEYATDHADRGLL